MTENRTAPDRIKLAVEDVSKTFRVRGGPGEKDSLLPVLRHISFAVGENEIVSLVGESGCGKTTLLRIVQGLVRLDHGTIRLVGHVVQGPGRRTTDHADSHADRAEEEERRSDPGTLAGAPGADLLLLQLSGRVDRQNPHGVGGGEPGVLQIARCVVCGCLVLEDRED